MTIRNKKRTLKPSKKPSSKRKKLSKHGFASVAETKAKLSKYLARAKAGEETIVTEFNTPIARIVPFFPVDKDFEIIPATSSIEEFHKELAKPGIKRDWDSLTLLSEDREDREY